MLQEMVGRDAVEPQRGLMAEWEIVRGRKKSRQSATFVAAGRRLALPNSVATLGEVMRWRVSSLRLDSVSPYQISGFQPLPHVVSAVHVQDVACNVAGHW
jgi:hypothetical protein